MIVERIRKEAAAQNKTIARLEREAGLGNGTIRKWNDNIPSVEKLARIGGILGKSLDYLYYGDDNPDPMARGEAELLRLYRSIPEEHRSSMLAYMRGFLDSSDNKFA